MQLAPSAATVLETTLTEATQKLGRAITDPKGLRAFKESGAAITNIEIDLAARLQETGDIAGAQAVRLQVLQRVLAGSGEADTKGLYGATARLARSFDDLEKAAGKKIFGDNLDLVESAIGLFKRWKDQIDETHVSLTKLAQPGELAKQSWSIFQSMISGFKEPVKVGKREVTGMIDYSAVEKAAAQAKKIEQQKTQAADEAYKQEKIRVNAAAQNAAIAYAEEIQSQRHFLELKSSALEDAYKRDLIASEDYYAAQKQLAIDGANAEQAYLEKQIKAKGAARDIKIPGTDVYAATPEERMKLGAEIQQLRNQANKVRFDLEEKQQKIDQQQAETTQKQVDSYEDLRVKLLEVTRGASAAGDAFEAANREINRAIAAQKTSIDPQARRAAEEAERVQSALKQHTIEQAKLNELQKEYAGILADVQTAQEAIDTQVALGNVSELDGLNQKSKLIKEHIGLLEQEITKYEQLAASASASPQEQAAALQAIKRMRLEIDQLTVSMNALEIKFRTIGVDAFTQFLSEVETRSKSAKEAFMDFVHNIVAGVSQVANKNIAEAIFGKAGAGGQGMAWLASLFSGTGGGGAAGAGSSGWVSGFDLPGFAGGGAPPVGRPFIVGERGPEILQANEPTTVTPISDSKQRPHLTVVVNVPAGTTRESADQIALRTGTSVNRVLARNS
jgi:hypothetical protein